MNSTRRKMLLGTLFGAGYVGLRSLATGLPPSWLLGGAEARADDPADLPTPDFLILSTSNAGDPVNANCPGSYVGGVDHHPDFAGTRFSLGSKTTTAAAPWAALPEALRARMAFFHHRTYSNAHPEHGKVMNLFGASKSATGNGSEMLVSAFADAAADRLGTIQREPIAVGKELITFEGRPLQNVDPAALKSLFDQPEDLFGRLQELRDRELDAIYGALKSNGTYAQKRFLDRYALGREQARKLGGDLIGLLQALPAAADETANPSMGQVIAAVALVKLKVAPVITIHIPFGGDNHNDGDLANERDETQSGVQAIGAIWDELNRHGIQDQVSFALLNVFGRTLKRNTQGGRNHNANHHVMPIFGKRVRPGVIGGIDGGGAGGIDSTTGAMSASGDIPAGASLESAAKTLAASLGFERGLIDGRIQGGKVVEAAIAG